MLNASEMKATEKPLLGKFKQTTECSGIKQLPGNEIKKKKKGFDYTIYKR